MRSKEEQGKESMQEREKGTRVERGEGKGEKQKWRKRKRERKESGWSLVFN